MIFASIALVQVGQGDVKETEYVAVHCIQKIRPRLSPGQFGRACEVHLTDGTTMVVEGDAKEVAIECRKRSVAALAEAFGQGVRGG